MLKLNLLPPKEKYKQKLERINHLVIFISAGLLAILLIFILLLTGIWFYLSRIEVSGLSEPADEISKKVNDLNEKLININQIIEERIVWSQVLEELSQKVPSGVNLVSLNLNRENRKIDLRGQAQLREQLLAFQDNLEKSPQFVDIYSPLANLIKPTNLDFILSFYLLK